MTEDEMLGQHHQLSGFKFEQTLGDSEGQESLTYCSPWGRKELDMIQHLNNNNKLLEISQDCEEIQPVHSKGDQSWVFIGRTDVDAETPILWLPDAKN